MRSYVYGSYKGVHSDAEAAAQRLPGYSESKTMWNGSEMAY